jgi:hypothetical protein
MSRASQSRPLHDSSGVRRAQTKRRSVPAHAHRRSLGILKPPRPKILSRQLDANVARRRYHVRLHVRARSAPPRPDPHARPPTRLPPTPQHSRHLALGKTLETGWPHNSPALTHAKAVLFASAFRSAGLRPAFLNLVFRSAIDSNPKSGVAGLRRKTKAPAGGHRYHGKGDSVCRRAGAAPQNQEPRNRAQRAPVPYCTVKMIGGAVEVVPFTVAVIVSL